jgi:hypothetical protein
MRLPNKSIAGSVLPHGAGCKLPGLVLGSAPKSPYHGLGRGAVVRAGADVSERQVSIPIEDEGTTHPRQVELLRTPHPSPQDEADVAPDRTWWRDCHGAAAPKTPAPVAEALGIGQPEKGVTQAFSEALQLIGGGKRDHRHPPFQLCNLRVELPQLREMLLAEESTQVAKKNQDGRLAKQFVSVEEPTIERHEVKVEIDPHRIMMRVPEHQSVIRITEEPRPRRWNRESRTVFK